MQTPPSRAKNALRRLIFLVISAVVLVIFAYGWTVTDIDFTITQEPQRQQNVQSALRELLSPNVFTQNYALVTSTTAVTIGCDAEATPLEETNTGSGRITVEPACADANAEVTVHGTGFEPNALSRLNWIGEDGERRIRQVVGSNNNNFFTDSNGSFSVQIEVPRMRGSVGQTHMVEAQIRTPDGLPTFSDTSKLVGERMVETIFLALIATAVSILPSAILSFFAANNLMRPIHMPLGNLLVFIILFPIGWWLGSSLLGELGLIVLNLTSGRGLPSATALGGVGLFFIFGTAVSSRSLGGFKEGSPARAVINTLVLSIVSIIGFGIIGGVSLLLGQHLTGDIIVYVGRFAESVGEIAELIILPVGGVIGAFALASIGTTLTKDTFKHINVTTSHILGGILGALAGAVILGFTATIATGAAWMGLLTPIIAAALGAGVAPELYRRFAQPNVIPLPRSARITKSLLGWFGGIITFVIVFSLLNVRQAIVEGALPSQVTAFTIGDFVISDYLLKAMIVGAILGALSGALSNTRSDFPIGSILYTITRTLLNALRSIEPLIMGLVFVIWVGIGPFAGVLALALHSIASLGKLYSEQIENIDAGPIEALQSTGANHLQTIMYAVVPQIIPPYIAFTMYRWDINVRMSTIIGFVGGGGIGFLLQQQINLLRYRDAGVAVLAIAIVVSILDYASAAIREKYI